MLHRGQGFGKTSRLLRSLRDYFVFELSKGSEEFAGFEWFDDERIGPHPARLFWFEGLQFADREQHGNACGLAIFLHPLTNFQTAVARHIHVEHNQVRLLFCNFLECGRPIVDRDHLIAGIAEDSPAHVLGSYAVIGEQDSSRQGLSSGQGEIA